MQTGIRNTPAFWSYDQLARMGVHNCTGFDRRVFEWKYGRQPAEVVVSALNERREYFLMFSLCCWRFPLEPRYWRTIALYPIRRMGLIPWLRWHIAWFRLWLTERLAGPVQG